MPKDYHECDFCWSFIVPNQDNRLVCPHCGYDFGELPNMEEIA